MQKYWKVISIAAVIVVVIGTFYMQSTLAANKLPQFKIETISGDEKEIASLLLGGLYSDPTIYRSEYIDLGVKGSTFARQQSLFERLDEYYPSSQSAKLTGDHKGFMRDKHWSNLLFEDEQSIVHVDITYKQDIALRSKIIVSILDKQTNKQTKFDYQPESNGWIDLLKIRVTNDQLQVITRNETILEGHANYGIHQYTFDLTKGQLLNDEVLVDNLSQGTDGGYVSIYTLNEINQSSESNKFVGVSSVAIPITDEYGGWVEEVNEQTLLIYDLDKGTPIDIDINTLEKYGDLEFYDHEHLYFKEINPENDIKIHAYHMEKREIVNTMTIPASGGYSAPAIVADQGKIVLVDMYKDLQTKAYVTVFDVGKQEVVYQGEIVSENIDHNYQLDISLINFK